MDRGYIKLYREIDEKPLWDDKPFTEGQAWIDLLLLACWKPRVVKIRGIKIKLNPGQLIGARQYLADRWGWGSRWKVDRFMTDLKTDNRIEQQKNNVCKKQSGKIFQYFEGRQFASHEGNVRILT